MGVEISIINKGQISQRIHLYEVGIHLTSEFMNEPENFLSKEDKIKFILENINEKFYKILAENL